MFRLFSRDAAASSRSAVRSQVATSRQMTSSAVARDAQAEAKKAADTAQAEAKKAADTAKSTAQGASKQLDGAVEKAKQIGQSLAQRAQPYVGSYADPIIYNLKVFGHVAKQVYIAESLAPPKSLSTVVDAYKTFYSRAANKEYYQRLLKTGEWKKVGLYAVEAYGIFTIGEMIGRRSVIGYDIQKHGDGGHH